MRGEKKVSLSFKISKFYYFMFISAEYLFQL